MSFRQEVDMLARSLGCKLICTSVKDDVNVNNVFRYLASRCLIEIQKEEQEYMSGNGVHQTYTIGKHIIDLRRKTGVFYLILLNQTQILKMFIPLFNKPF